jgi:hypothetical protein
MAQFNAGFDAFSRTTQASPFNTARLTRLPPTYRRIMGLERHHVMPVIAHGEKT